jgi:hypothetical protein
VLIDFAKRAFSLTLRFLNNSKQKKVAVTVENQREIKNREFSESWMKDFDRHEYPEYGIISIFSKK